MLSAYKLINAEYVRKMMWLRLCGIFLLLMGLIVTVEAQETTASKLELTLRALSTQEDVSLAQIGDLYTQRNNDPTPDIKVATIRATALGLLYLGENENYQKIRANIPNVDEFEAGLGTRCPDCGGTGKTQSDCNRCGGTGVCKALGCQRGTVVTPGFDGKTVTRRCGVCMGSGRCAECSRGKKEGVCTRCFGRGRLLSKNNLYARYKAEISSALTLLNREKHPQMSATPARGIASSDFFNNVPSRKGDNLLQPKSHNNINSDNPVLGEPISKSTESPRAIVTLDSALAQISRKLLKDLQLVAVKRLAISKIYFNGSSTQPVAQFIQRRFVGVILENAPSELSVLERSDLALLVKENSLQWMLGSGEENMITEGEALLMGEFLFSNSYNQGLLSIRVFDSKSTALLFAQTVVVDLDKDMAQRLGTRYQDLPRTAFFAVEPRITSNENFVNRLKTGGTLSLSPISALPQKFQFAARSFYAYMVSDLLNAGVQMNEREFIYQISQERTLVEDHIDPSAVSKSILQIVVDESSSELSPTFFIKATQRAGGVLIGQTEVKLQSASVTRSLANNMPSQRMTSIGSDDSLEKAIIEYEEAATVKRHDELIFKKVFQLSREMGWSPEEYASLRWKWFTQRTWKNWNNEPDFNPNQLGEIPTETIDGYKAYDDLLRHLIPYSKSSTERLKAQLITYALFGYQNAGIIGPVSIIQGMVAKHFTINNNRKPSDDYWYRCFDSFANWYARSLDPVERVKLESPAEPYKGSFQYEKYRKVKIVFDYNIEIDWQGKYPATVAVTIDLSPMRNQLYNVKQDSVE